MEAGALFSIKVRRSLVLFENIRIALVWHGISDIGDIGQPQCHSWFFLSLLQGLRHCD